LFPAGDNTVLTGPSRHLALTRFRLGLQEGRHIEHATGPIYTLFSLYNYLKLIQQSFVPQETSLHTSPQASQHQQCQRQQSCSTHIAAVLFELGHSSVLVDFRKCAVCLHLHSYSKSTGRRTQGTSEMLLSSRLAFIYQGSPVYLLQTSSCRYKKEMYSVERTFSGILFYLSRQPRRGTESPAKISLLTNDPLSGASIPDVAMLQYCISIIFNAHAYFFIRGRYQPRALVMT
jgi:hypothetical protein